MRIVIDMQGAQTESKFRGIGRYTLCFAQGVARNRGEHEVFLALNGSFPESVEYIRRAFDDLLPQENILVWHSLGPVNELTPGNNLRREAAEIIREAFLASLSPDIIHIPSLFEGHVDDAVTSIDRLGSFASISVTVHDFIPFFNSDKYLTPNPIYKDFYHRKIVDLKKASLYLAVSESSRLEAIEVLKRPAKLFVNGSEGCEAVFKPSTYTNAELKRLKKKFGLLSPFVLYGGGSDERKNLPRLIEAYAMLPARVRGQHQLILAGKMPEGDIKQLKHLAERLGLAEGELLFTGYVSDEELLALYNTCKLFVFPSWHEGFGLPALEAMSCGAPVIGANTTSLPEVIGCDEALFNPFDVTAISSKLQDVLTDEELRNRLCEHAIKQTSLFSWDKTAKLAIVSWERVLAETALAQPISYACVYKHVIEEMSAILLRSDADMLLHVAKAVSQNENVAAKLSFNNESIESQIWRIEGPFDSTYSLALLNREIARSLSEFGAQVALHSTEGPGDFEPNTQFLIENPDLAQMHELAQGIEHSDATVVSRNLYPPRVEDMCGSFNLLHSYAWEEAGFPMEWVQTFNKNLNGVACLSEHVRKILRDNGVSLPLSVSGCGVDHWERITASENCVLDKFDTKAFRFLHVSSFFPRKGPIALLEAWAATFSKADDVCLVIKTFPNPHNIIHELLDELAVKYPDAAQIVVIEDDLSDSQIKAIYERCHVLVAPSYAEGFCLPIAEAMLSGIPAITTNWSGQLDFCRTDNSWLVDFTFEKTDTHFELHSSVWAKVNTGSLAKAMQAAYETTAAERRAMARRGRELLLADLTWNKVAERLIASKHKFRGAEFDEPPKVGWISTWNTKCGIATYSEHLTAAFSRAPIILAAHVDHPLVLDLPNCVRCWTADGSDTLEKLTQMIERHQLDTLVVQFNFGFFDHDQLNRFVSFHKQSGRTIVLEMHAVIDPPHAPDKKLINYFQSLKLADRLLVHSIDDLNLLKELGLVENVTLFPHGVLDIGELEQQSFIVPTISTYGFCLPHKGLGSIIDAVAILRDRGFDVKLNMINAEYPADISKNLIEQLKTKIRKLSLEEQITLKTQFLSDDESVAILKNSDLVVFAYDSTSESASGAVRYGLASATPTLVTDIPIFKEFGDIVWKVKDNHPQSLANALTDVLAKIRNNAPEHNIKQSLAQTWRKQHSFVWLSQRLEGMIVGLHRDNEDGA